MQINGRVRKLRKRFNTPWDAHELTFSCFQKRPFLKSERLRLWFAEAVDRARAVHAFDLWAYVLMPEHVHLLVWPRNETYSIAAILKAIKQSASRKAINWLRAENPAGLAQLGTGLKYPAYRLWQDGGGYDRNIHNAKTLRNSIEYIHGNPVRRKLVEQAEHWEWSSCADWSNGVPGPIALDKESCMEAMQ